MQPWTGSLALMGTHPRDARYGDDFNGQACRNRQLHAKLLSFLLNLLARVLDVLSHSVGRVFAAHGDRGKNRDAQRDD
jgi:hypothetical protein